jgi:hypothetical protein
MAYVIVRWVSTLVLSATNFINRFFLFGLTAPNPRGTRNHLDWALSNSGLASGDSGLQLNLEIAQAVSQRRLSRSTGFQASRKCVEASDNVIKGDFANSADNRQ